MLRAWIEDVIGRLKQLGTHADGLEEENRKLQAELSALHEARRDNDDTFTVRQWDPAGRRHLIALDQAADDHLLRRGVRDAGRLPVRV
jgi:hypothetical protein